MYTHTCMTRCSFHKFPCVWTYGLGFIQYLLRHQKCRKTSVKIQTLRSPSLCVKTQSFGKPQCFQCSIWTQVFLCLSQILPCLVTLQKTCLLKLAIYSPTASCMAKPHGSSNGAALRAPVLPRHLCCRTHSGAQQKGNSHIWVPVSLSHGHHAWSVSWHRHLSVSPLYLAPTPPCGPTTINTFSW